MKKKIWACGICGSSASHSFTKPNGEITLMCPSASLRQKKKAAGVFARPFVITEKHKQILIENLRKEKEKIKGGAR